MRAGEGPYDLRHFRTFGKTRWTFTERPNLRFVSHVLHTCRAVRFLYVCRYVCTRSAAAEVEQNTHQA